MRRKPLIIGGVIAAVAVLVGTFMFAVTGGAATSALSATCNTPSYDGQTFTITCNIPQATVTATQTVTVTATPSGSPTTTSPTPTPTVTTTAPTGLSLSQVDGGGPAFYSKFASNSIPTSSSFFPIGVWEQNYCQANEMLTDGINVLVNPAGSPAGTSGSVCSSQQSITLLQILDDEVDMWAGPGNAAWTGNYPGQGTICNPSSAACGYTIMAAHDANSPAGALRYANYGKGVEFWETNAQAAQFVNQYQDATSADLYWATDPDLCQASQGGVLLGTNAALSSATCHKASNYGVTVDRIRSLESPVGSKPIFNYIEIGHPGTAGTSMPPAEIKAAVWSSLIHGARGIVYFDHSFGGSCVTDDVLADCTQSTTTLVQGINAQITSLATVLNSPIVNGVTTTGGLDAAAHFDGHNVYVFAEPNGTTSINGGSIKVAGDTTTGTATVLGEGRTVPVTNGVITDSFATANTVHLYEIN